MGWITLLLDVVMQITYLVTDSYQPERLPLHLCSLGVICVFIDGLRPNRVAREVIYALTWWGAFCALAFPDWVDRPIMNIFVWQSFAAHLCLFAYGLMLIVAGEYWPNWRQLGRVALVLLGWLVLAAVVNHFLGTNFCYLNQASPGSPLEPIQALAGSWYIPVLAGLLALLWLILYAPWAWLARRRAALVSQSGLAGPASQAKQPFKRPEA
jgi:hypothetical integral membrane protein (TIGR02206 family)